MKLKRTRAVRAVAEEEYRLCVACGRQIETDRNHLDGDREAIDEEQFRPVPQGYDLCDICKREARRGAPFSPRVDNMPDPEAAQRRFDWATGRH